ncbi:MAG: YraN family protein [Acidobacteriota bacterium]
MSLDFKMSVMEADSRSGKWLRWLLARASGGGGRRGADSRSFGEWGEHLAVRYLEKNGFRVAMTNFCAPIGQRRDRRLVTGEIDIIGYDLASLAPVLVFVEVKTRSSEVVATPESAVNRRKQRQIVRTAKVYRRLLRVWEEQYRYDVLTILARHGQRAEISLHRAYFDDEIFRGVLRDRR